MTKYEWQKKGSSGRETDKTKWILKSPESVIISFNMGYINRGKEKFHLLSFMCL